MKNLSILGVQWKIQLLGGGGGFEKPICRGALPKKGRVWKVCWFKGSLARKKRGFEGVGGEGFDTPVSTMIILFHLELLIIDLPKINSSILMDIVTIPVDQVDEFHFYMHHLVKAWLFEKNYLWTSLSFSYSLKITCILLRQVISLKKMVVLSVKFTILISWSPICIPLILLLISINKIGK